MTRQDFISFAANRIRKISAGCLRKLSKPENSEFLNYLQTNSLQVPLPLKEKLYLYFYDYKSSPVCKNCGKLLTLKSGQFGQYCNNKCQREDFKKRLIETYGVDNISKLESTKEKRIATNMIVYGGKAPMSSQAVKDKATHTKIERYNDRNFNNRDSYRNTCLLKYDKLSTNQVGEIKNKQKQARIQNGSYSKNPDRNKYRVYCRDVHMLSETLNRKFNIENKDARAEKGYHLDHIYSCIDGYSNYIHPLFVSHLCNLRYIYWLCNMRKGRQSDITIVDLLSSIILYHKESKETILEMYNLDIDDKLFIKYPIDQLIDNLQQYNLGENLKFLLKKEA